MEFFIKKLFDGKTDEDIHLHFQKLSRGEFKDRALIKAKKTGNHYSIGTSYEYANELVKGVAEKLSGSVKVTGAIISTRDLTNEIKFKDKKQFHGVKRYIIDTEMTKEQLINLCEKFPKSFLALSFNSENTKLKIKPKAPKSSKPGKLEGEPKADFCKLKTSELDLVKGLLFDIPNFKVVNIKHDFIITDIEIPEGIKDPNEMREKAIRKGKVIRKSDIDGRKVEKEIKFMV